MKRYSILLVLFVAGGILFESEAQAQAITVSVKREAMSPGRLQTYTAGTFPVSTGLRVVPRGMKVYLSAATTGNVTTYAWELAAVPNGSAAAIDTATNKFVRFVPDVVGQYIVKVTVDSGKTAFDTLYASTYAGLAAQTGCICHNSMNPTLIPGYRQTGHATIFARGITGQLETQEYQGSTVGVYNTSCIKCHTTGWDQTVDNGNFGFEAKKTGFDTTWYKIGQFVNNEYYMPFKDSTSFLLMQSSYPAVALVAQIGCESCHGPAKDHSMTGNKALIAKSYEAGACLQCHDAPAKHRLGSYWAASTHATMATSAEEAGRSSCWPCHSGSALPAYLENRTSPNYANTPVVASINCVTCHDPHSTANPNQLRTVYIEKLANNYMVPAGLGGKGQLCMNCHHARTNATTVIAAMQRVFGDRFYPHYSPQADMFLGANAVEYGLPITGLGTHQQLQDGCVTCHMTKRINGSSEHSNHEMAMEIEGQPNTTACKQCHGNVADFDDVKAASDYDGDGTVEGFQSEITGLLDQLRDLLPKDSFGEPVTMKVDSLKVKNDPNWPKNLSAIWNYYFVKNDFSLGIHNPKYAVAILRASLGTLSGIEAANQDVPRAFALEQNYPNPFNPSTTVHFSVPRSGSITLYVYNSAGEMIAKLADGTVAPGNYTAAWNGLDMHGNKAATGLYFYRLIVNDNGTTIFNGTRKMMLLK
jgi:predicted CXXCH cytochrome family protein